MAVVSRKQSKNRCTPAIRWTVERTQTTWYRREGGRSREKEERLMFSSSSTAGLSIIGISVTEIEKLLDRMLSRILPCSYSTPLVRNKVEDVLFAAGEALSFFLGDVPVTADVFLKTNYTLPLACSKTSLSRSSCTEPELNEELSVVIRSCFTPEIIDNLLYGIKKEERCAGTIWLVLLIIDCCLHPNIQHFLPEIQFQGRNEASRPRRCVELPEDLWIQIFLRLPVKSLLLVTCVCKYWYGLIKNPSFTRTHLQSQKMMSKDSGHFILQHSHFDPRKFNYFLFDGEFTTSGPTSTLPYRNLLHFPDGRLIIDGPINGLYCIYNKAGRIVIWNPTTDEVVFLPLPEQFLPDSGYMRRHFVLGVIGFGVDPLDDENYKVVLMGECDYDNWNDMRRRYGLLYTTKTNTWRFLEDPLVTCRGYGQSLNNTYLNGSYYWSLNYKYGLVCDMSYKEAFREILTPANGDFALHDDHINLFSMDKNLNEIDVWVMLSETNWLKKISVKGIQARVQKPLGFWKTENEMLLVVGDYEGHFGCHHSTQTVLYNITTGGIRYLGPQGHPTDFMAPIYYESLVSLSGGITKCRVDSSLDEIRYFLEESDDDTDSDD